MSHIRHKVGKKIFVSIGILSLCVFVVTQSGCETLHRKFTRKKKKDKDESQKFIPVLEPVDYPEKVYSPLDQYKKHYSLWRVWDKDLLGSIEQEDSDKRQKHLLAQAVEQLEEMHQLLPEERKIEFAPLVEHLRSVEEIFEKPASMRNKFSIKKEIERNGKEIRTRFSPDPTIFNPEE